VIPIDHDARGEDLQWLADTGENAIGAAARLGLSFAALERWARRNMPETWAVLLERNPRDANARSGGANQWRKSA
jgi:hypothetical protein